MSGEAIISLCLSGNGEAAIVYTSPKGKRTVVARSVAYRGMMEAGEFLGHVGFAIMMHKRGCFAPRDTATYLAKVKQEGMADLWDFTITNRELARMCVGNEVKP